MKFKAFLVLLSAIAVNSACGPSAADTERALLQRIAEKQTLERDLANMHAQMEGAKDALATNNGQVEAERVRLGRIEGWQLGRSADQRDAEIVAESKVIQQMEEESKTWQKRIDSLIGQQDLLTARLATYADVDAKMKSIGVR